MEAGKDLSYKIKAVLVFPLGMEIVIKLFFLSLSGFGSSPAGHFDEETVLFCRPQTVNGFSTGLFAVVSFSHISHTGSTFSLT